MPNERPTLLVSEIFGPTLQGEGPSTGRPCMFLRLGGCNLQCVWCDTPYTWDATRFDLRQELKQMGFMDIKNKLNVGRPGIMLVVSGGEPLLQDLQLMHFFDSLAKGTPAQQATRVEVETAGTLIPTHTWPYVDQFNVSPKLAHSGNSLSKRRRLEVLKWFGASGKSIFKFVCVEDDDLNEVDEIVQEARIMRDRVYIMPEGITQEKIDEHTRALVPSVLARGYNLTQRLHITLWGNRRGV